MNHERAGGPRSKKNGRAMPGRFCSEMPIVYWIDDLDAAVLRLAHAVAGLHQQALLAAADRP